MLLGVLLFFSIFISVAVGYCATIYMGLATFSFLLLVQGLYWRRNQDLHVFFMNCGIAIDLALVLVLELQRSAIDTAVTFELNPWQQAHIAFSSLAVVFYFPTIYLGWQRRVRPSVGAKVRYWHIRMGCTAFVLRTIGYFLMFSLLSHVR